MVDKNVSVIFPTYNEKKSIYMAINDFLKTGYVNEIIVVNNNAVDGTDDEVKKTNAKIIYEKKQGYGYAIQKGLENANGDYIIIAEPDGTFFGRDVIKLLAYSDDFDYVIGTRTKNELICEGANMDWFLKWGNRIVAGLMSFLFNSSSLSDMGCTMRLIKKNVYKKIKNKFTVGGSHFGPEMTLLIIAYGIPYIEIPVNYNKRIGESSVTGNKFIAFLLGLKMIGLVFKYWFKNFLKSLSKENKIME